MASNWLWEQHPEAGPYTFQELAELVSEGTLEATDGVRREGDPTWTPVEDVVGLLRAAKKVKCPAPNAKELLQQQILSALEIPEEKQRARIVLSIKEKVMVTSSGLVLCLLAFQVFSYWSSLPERFPDSKGVSVEFHFPGRLDQMRPKLPSTPSVPGLPFQTPVRVPGLEQIPWAKSPSLSQDMLQIVFVSNAREGSLDDLFFASRQTVEAPFGEPIVLRWMASGAHERFPAISPDGLQLIYLKVGKLTQIMYSSRKNRSEPFSAPVPIDFEADDQILAVIDGTQFFDSQTIRFRTCDATYKQCRQLVGRRTKEKESVVFKIESVLPISNPWPRYFMSKDHRRLYFATENGIHLTALHLRAKEFLTPETLLSEKVLQGTIAKSNSSIWVSSKEDVLFYCCPDFASDSESLQLWMIRL